MQAAPLQSPPSTGLRHYSAASKHMSDGWDSNSDTRVLEWAESCSQGTHAHTHIWHSTLLSVTSSAFDTVQEVGEWLIQNGLQKNVEYY